MTHVRASLIEERERSLGPLAAALALIPDGFAWLDGGGRVVWCNPAFRALGGSELAAKLADRVLRDNAVIDETHETSLGPLRKVIEVYSRRCVIDGETAAVMVVRDVTESACAQDEMRRLNRKLEAANAELEAFSYSVSHDLRTPLRAIEGFSKALLEDYESVLAPEGREYLRRLRTAAQHMGRLIQDLLRLSRGSRAELATRDVDLSAMAREIIGELGASMPGRRVDVAIEDGLVARGDEHWLRQAMENLLGNAWKFTGKTPDPRIEVGCTKELDGGERVFFVRDNGAGFAMNRADKLFGAFQRLHPADEFPGTGIGLAIVRRIVHRHGGRIWADAAPGKGATFYFTLPAAKKA